MTDWEWLTLIGWTVAAVIVFIILWIIFEVVRRG
jgi:hypothetical protein